MNQTALTEQILEFWRTDDTFRKSLQERSSQRSFRFYDGPPFTSGDPHYGHLLQSTVKDMVPRWMTMRGYHVDRKRGRDCHGIPAENFVNKQLGITSKKQVESEYGVGPYVEECRKMVNQVNDNRKWFVDHVGRWVDMDNAYFTMDNDFMESVIWVFSDLYNKNLIYKGFKVLGYSRALGTALSASEIAEGYEDRQDPAVTVKFKIQNTIFENENFSRTEDCKREFVRAIIKNEQGAILHIFQKKWDKRFLPGGGVDINETPDQAIIREIKEEIGCEVDTLNLVGSYVGIFSGYEWMGYYYDVTIHQDPIIQEPDNHTEITRIGVEDNNNELGFAIKVQGLIIEDYDEICYKFHHIYMYYQFCIKQFQTISKDCYFLAWTTTPWTLPSNMFLAVNSKLTYVQIYHKESNCYYILAKNLLSKTFKNPAEYVVIYQMKGKELLGLRYQPIFPYIQNARGKMQDNFYRHSEGNETKGSVIEESFGEHTGDPSTSSGGPRDNKEHNTKNDQGTGYIDKMFQVLDADFVTDDAGTGIAHEAPAFGELDYNLVAGFLGRETAAEWLFNPVDDNGEFTAEVAEWEGMNVITASSEITKFLKHRGDIIKHETINHSYPHCPRTGTPLIYRAMESRFVKEDQLKAQSVPLAETINFVPPSVKNRFIEGLKSAPDWNISRSRYWGAPLPVWISENGQGDPLVLGSREEIYQWSKTGSKNIMKVSYIRHGETDFNARNNISDEKGEARLTTIGKKQAEILSDNLQKQYNFEQSIIFLSPYYRTLETIIPYISQYLNKEIIEEISKKHLQINENFKILVENKKCIEYVQDANNQLTFQIYDNIFVDYRLVERLLPEMHESEVLLGINYFPTWSYEPMCEGYAESARAVFDRHQKFFDEMNQKYIGKGLICIGHAGSCRLVQKFFKDYDINKYWGQYGLKNCEVKTFYYDTLTKKELDLHRPYIDNIRFMKDGVRYNRIPEVLDCWFESGSMPYGQEKFIGMQDVKGKMKDYKQGTFNPTANFIAEGLDQTRGWFRSLHVLGTATFTKPIFENVVVTGMILAEDGKKMSKSKKNFPDPKGLLEQYGPDAFRLYLLSSPVVRSEPLRFKEKDVEQVLKDVLLPLHNIVNFFSTYAKVDNYKNPGTEVYFMRHACAGNQVESASSGELVETERTKETPLNETGLQQIQSEKFIEEIGRVMPDIILSSDFTRAIQTAEGAQKVLKDVYGKEIELIQTSNLGMDADVDTISEIFDGLLEQYQGKKILIVSHNLRFRYLWKNLIGFQGDVSDAENKKKYGITNTQIIKLPLIPLTNELDQWMYSELYTLIGQLDQELAGYRLDSATKFLLEFIEKLSNRYLRRSRRRFRANGMDADKLAAYHTLYEVMTTYLKLLAPFAPFTTEYLWKWLQDFSSVGDKNRSIHLEYRPLPGNKYINAELMDEIQMVRTIIKQALFVRAKNQINVQIPLRKMEIKINE